jgi:outer membrane receptor protein involved in Fe transport
MSRLGLRGCLLANTALAVVLCAFVVTSATAQTQTVSFDIPPEPLGASLRDFARQSGQQIIFTDDLVAGKSSPTLHGSYAPDAALAVLLRSSGLVAERSPSGSVMVRPKNAEAASDDGAATGLLRVETVTVTGTRISGDQEVPSPVTTISRADFLNQGWTSTTDIFRDLPQNLNDITPIGGVNEGASSAASANNDHTSGIDLRGLGPQSTLTLLNGTRRAGGDGGRSVDISGLPLSMIDHIDIVTGGDSSIYGSDAVAGVVNIVTRRDFEGIEAETSIGTGDHGGQKLTASLLGGMRFDGGGFVIGYEYGENWARNLAGTDLFDKVNPDGSVYRTYLSQSPSEQHALFLSGHYSVSPDIELVADGQFTHRDITSLTALLYPTALNESTSRTALPNDQYSASLGLRALLGGDWKLTVDGTTSANYNSSKTALNTDLGFFSYQFDFNEKTRVGLSTISSVADGTIAQFYGMDLQGAFGAEYRRESYFDNQASFVDQSAAGVVSTKSARQVYSTFGELSLKLINNPERGETLKLVASARYDNYSDFGGTTNPQVGLVWQDGNGFGAKASYSTSFRAPTLVELGSSTSLNLQQVPDPILGGADRNALIISGDNPALGPEKASSWTASISYVPSFLEMTRLSVDYFNITYRDRLDVPVVGTDLNSFLVNSKRYPGLIDRSPASTQLASLLAATGGFVTNTTPTPFDPATQTLLATFPDLVVLDDRIHNIAIDSVDGVDVNLDTGLDTDHGIFAAGINATYTPDHDRRVTQGSIPFSLLNEVGKQVGFRFRANVRWSDGPFSAFAYVNYVDKYRDPFSFLVPAGPISSWTTVDTVLLFSGDKSDLSDTLQGFDLSFGVTNLFDQKPPLYLNSLSGIRYDTTNATDQGRFLTLRLVKHF